jgi:type II secretory pathway predicted ATPase ExeA
VPTAELRQDTTPKEQFPDYPTLECRRKHPPLSHKMTPFFSPLGILNSPHNLSKLRGGHSTMDALYQTHFGLSQAPFNITPDPSFLYLSASHREGLAQLSYGIRARKGFVVLTGEVGTGKTTLIHALLNDLNGSAHTALIFSAIVSPADLLRTVCEEFGLIEPKRPLQEIHDYLVCLNEFLLESYRKAENCALIIDEAQNLSAEVLESVRLLSNFETSKHKLLQILLVGQPELALRLNSPELRQLKQRVMLRHHLRVLSLQECCEYVSNRLKVAGADRTIFTPTALESIYSCSGGIPRIVNVLCDNALLTAYALGRKEIDTGIIREVAENFSITTNAEARFKPIIRQGVNNTNSNGSGQGFGVGPVEARSGIARLEPKRAHVIPIPKSIAATSFLPASFLDALVSALTDAMGPMAKMVLRDQIKTLGESSERFPHAKVEMLLESVSSEILDEGMREQFRQRMLERIRALQAS